MRDILKDALNNLAAFFAEISNWCGGTAYDISGIPLISRLQDNFILLQYFFGEISWFFLTLRDSLLRIYDQAQEILTWDYIWQEIQVRLPDLSLVADWVENAWEMITGVINFWWDYMSVEVQGWITNAVLFIGNTIDAVKSRVSELESAWHTFITVTLPSLPSLIVIDDLIASWFKDYEPFWSGWQEWKSQVTEFFTDPGEWLYNKFDDFFERFW